MNSNHRSPPHEADVDADQAELRRIEADLADLKVTGTHRRHHPDAHG